MGKRKNIQVVGLVYGKLIITKECPSNGKDSFVMVKCECGTEKMVALKHLRSGSTKTCGCVNPNESHGLSGHPLYTVWEDMLDRCYNANSKNYHRYGGRGVSVSDRWRHDFESFYQWAIDKWKPGLRLDKDVRSEGVVGDFYCPELCCFITHKENMRNTGMNVFYEYNGEKLCVAEWCEKYGINRSAFNYRISRGWSFEQSITSPLKNRPNAN